MPLPKSLLLCSFAGVLAAPLLAQNPPAGFVYETLVDGPLNSATAMAFLPDGRLLITERTTGHVRLFANGSLQAAPWGTVPTSAGGSFSEAGLLGIAVDPGFLTNRFVYVFFTDTSGTQNHIARFEEQNGSGTNLTILNPANSLPGSLYHNGGAMVFGIDGTLFVSVGDGLTSSNSQTLANWQGKVLRFEVPFLTVPANNPIAGSPIFSLGHRNSFGLTIHPENALLYQTENGGGWMDEVNVIIPGGNYAWPHVEGTEVTPLPAFVDPLFAMQPTVAPTGTCFYAGDLYPQSYRNGWFFCDYNMNRLRMLTLDATGTAVVGQQLFDTLPGAGYGILNGPDGNLWMLNHDTGGFGADELGRYVHAQAPRPGAQLSAVSNKLLAAALTVGISADNGNLIVPWLALSAYGAPVGTPWGNLLVPVDAVLPVMLVQNDNRAYAGLVFPNAPAFLGASLWLQAAALAPSGTLSLSNSSQLRVRG
jgi:aldose sugar dehydrogenase